MLSELGVRIAVSMYSLMLMIMIYVVCIIVSTAHK